MTQLTLKDLLDFVNENFQGWCTAPKYELDFYRDLGYVVLYWPSNKCDKERTIQSAVYLQTRDFKTYWIYEFDATLVSRVNKNNYCKFMQLINWLVNETKFARSDL